MRKYFKTNRLPNLKVVRAKKLEEYTSLKWTEVSKQSYEDYASEMNRNLVEKDKKHRNKYRLLLTNIKLKKKTLDELVEKSLPKAKVGVVLDKVNAQIEKITSEIQELEDESKKL